MSKVLTSICNLFGCFVLFFFDTLLQGRYWGISTKSHLIMMAFLDGPLTKSPGLRTPWSPSTRLIYLYPLLLSISAFPCYSRCFPIKFSLSPMKIFTIGEPKSLNTTHLQSWHVMWHVSSNYNPSLCTHVGLVFCSLTSSHHSRPLKIQMLYGYLYYFFQSSSSRCWSQIWGKLRVKLMQFVSAIVSVGCPKLHLNHVTKLVICPTDLHWVKINQKKFWQKISDFVKNWSHLGQGLTLVQRRGLISKILFWRDTLMRGGTLIITPLIVPIP